MKKGLYPASSSILPVSTSDGTDWSLYIGRTDRFVDIDVGVGRGGKSQGGGSMSEEE
jgi:hypothetical protein